MQHDCSKYKDFNLEDIEVAIGKADQPQFERAYVGNVLEIDDIRTSLNGFEKCKMFVKQEFEPD